MIFLQENKAGELIQKVVLTGKEKGKEAAINGQFSFSPLPLSVSFSCLLFSIFGVLNSRSDRLS